MSLEFVWDEDKATANKKKHRVTFDEAATVFEDPLAAIFDDEVHSEEEQREIIVGHSAKNRLLLVCFTERAGAIRISVLAVLLNRSVKTMKKTPSTKQRRSSKEEMLPEYRFDYSKAKPNRFVARAKSDSRQVLLDPDVAEVFTTSESVNEILRALIRVMPKNSSN